MKKHIHNILSILIGIILFVILFAVVLWAVFITAPPPPTAAELWQQEQKYIQRMYEIQ